MADEEAEFQAVFSHDEPAKAEAEVPAEPEAPEPEKEPEPEAKAEPDPVTEEVKTLEPETEEAEKTAKEPISREDFKGYTDERDKRQKAEAERDSFKSQMEALQRNAEPAQETPRPDMFDDPDGYHAWNDQKQAQGLLNAKLDHSEIDAVREFGPEKVQEAKQAFQLIAPQDQQRLLAQQHPYRALIQEREQQALIGQINDAGGLDKMKESWLAEQSGKAAEMNGTIAKWQVKNQSHLLR
jgi:hypothetical protein